MKCLRAGGQLLPKERRISPRFALQVPITLTVPDAGLKVHGTTRDISGGGIFLYADAPVHTSDEIQLTLALPYQLSPSEVRVACRVKVLRLEQQNGSSSKGIATAIQAFDFLQE